MVSRQMKLNRVHTRSTNIICVCLFQSYDISTENPDGAKCMRMLELEASGFGAQSTSPLTQVSVSLEESAGTYNRQSSSPLLLSKFLLCFAQKFSESLVRHPLSRTYLGCDLVELTSQILVSIPYPVVVYHPAQFYQGLLQLDSLVLRMRSRAAFQFIIIIMRNTTTLF